MNKIIVDIDGTIANLDHRLPYILNKDGSQKAKGEKDWNGFHKNIIDDKPRMNVINMIDSQWAECDQDDIIFVTGRSEEFIEVTREWLSRCGFHYQGDDDEYYGYELIMRPLNNRIQDDELKRGVVNDLKKMYNITHVFEDRPRCLKMYREELPEAIIVDCGNYNHFKDER